MRETCAIFSGSAPFDESDLPGEILHLLHAARAVECVNSRTKSLVRFATFDGLALFPQDVDVGLIGVTEKEAAGASNRDMPYAVIVGSAVAEQLRKRQSGLGTRA